MRILLCEGTYYVPLNPYFKDALSEICRGRGYGHRFLDEANYLKQDRSLASRVTRRLLGLQFVMKARQRRFNQDLLCAASQFEPNIMIVVNGKWIEPSSLIQIKRGCGTTLVNWATDDAFNKKVTTQCFKSTIGLYDVYATPKKAAMPDYRAAGCASVIYAPFIYKPQVHYPEQPAGPDEAEQFRCDVAFLGTADPVRIEFVQRLCSLIPDLKVHLYGGGWSRTRALSRFARGFAEGRALRLAASQAAIMLNFVRHSNRDDHSERAVQLTACGAFLLSERTPTQLSMLSEDREAAFFDTVEEAAAKIRHYLAQPGRRDAVAAAGHRKTLSGGYDARSRLCQLLAAAGEVCLNKTESTGIQS